MGRGVKHQFAFDVAAPFRLWREFTLAEPPIANTDLVPRLVIDRVGIVYRIHNPRNLNVGDCGVKYR